MTFKQWMNLVNAQFSEFFAGMTSDDFDDWLWYEDFLRGETPEGAFAEWKEYNYDYL